MFVNFLGRTRWSRDYIVPCCDLYASSELLLDLQLLEVSNAEI